MARASSGCGPPAPSVVSAATSAFQLSSYSSSSSSPLLRILLLALFICSPLWCTRAEDEGLFQSKDYELGKLGRFPNVTYKSTEIFSPLFNIAEWSDECASDDYVMLSLHGNGEEVKNRLLIMTHKGGLIWSARLKAGPNHLQVLRLHDKDYLAYWEGGELHGAGFGSYYLLDETYTIRHNIRALGTNHTGDLHALRITETNTALFTVYEKRDDLEKYHYEGRKGYWYDGLVQEVDFLADPPRLVFEWRASDHFKFDDMGTNATFGTEDGLETHPWDWYHINSVEKDPWGNYLISARYSNAAVYVNGSDGKVIWTLGGKLNNFTYVTDEKKLEFACQHDIRWTDNFTAITLFDNSAYYGRHDTPARGMRIGLNFDKMEAGLLAEYHHPRNYQSESQGSHQVLENGHSFIGWGFTSGFSEFRRDGKLLCDTQFAPLFTEPEGGFSLEGYAQSYRAYKLKWIGYPAHDPEARFVDGRFYVTWNGATEVALWRLDGGSEIPEGHTRRRWRHLESFDKDGFESSCPVEDVSAYPMYRLVAYDSDNYVLGSWTVGPKGMVQKYTMPLLPDILYERPNWHFTIPVLMAIVLIYIFKRPRNFSIWRMVPFKQGRLRAYSASLA